MKSKMKCIVYTSVCVLLVINIAAQPAGKQKNNKDDNEWPAYGHDAGGSRFSPLDQINDKNANKLKVAWTFQTGELKTYEGTNAIEQAAFEATPIMIGNMLYFSTPTSRVFALDAATGKEK